jgi:hypothetical protein
MTDFEIAAIEDAVEIVRQDQQGCVTVDILLRIVANERRRREENLLRDRIRQAEEIG